MPRPVTSIIDDIQAFSPSTDYQNYSGDQHLRKLFDEAAASPASAQAVPAMLNVIERFPATHFYFGYLVRALENCEGYQPVVLEAVKKQPTPLVVMAVHRMSAENRGILEQVAADPQTSPAVKKLTGELLQARPVEQIIADFEQFTPTPDLNYTGRTRLWDLCHELLNTPKPARGIPAIMNIIERYPDVDFDVPGILVHTLEEIGGYEAALIASVGRVPAYLSVLMLKRIIYGLEQAGKSGEDYRKVLMAAAPDEVDT